MGSTTSEEWIGVLSTGVAIKKQKIRIYSSQLYSWHSVYCHRDDRLTPKETVLPHSYPQEDINVMFEAIMLLNDPIGIVISLLVHEKPNR